MTISDVKEYIYENKKIKFILEKLNCHNIKYNEKHGYYSASFPDGDNPQGINISNNKYLNYRSFSRNVSYEDGKDIIDLISYVTNKNFVDAIKLIHNILGLEYSPYKKQKKKEEKKDPLAIFKDAVKCGRRGTVNVDDIHVIDEEAINDYVPLLYIDWFREGIMPWARKKFGLAYSYKHKRVVIPLRYWLDGSLLGFNQRTTVENYEELGIRKYFITPSYPKSLNLYGLWENREEIERKKYVIVCESEKSVLKRYSLNDGTCVALQGKTLSEEQRRIILGLNVNEVIIALDNDVSIEEIRFMCEKFYRVKNVSYVKDRWGLLGEKDAPMDAKNKAFKFLIKYRTHYDESEHKKYLKSVSKKA